MKETSKDGNCGKKKEKKEGNQEKNYEIKFDLMKYVIYREGAFTNFACLFRLPKWCLGIGFLLFALKKKNKCLASGMNVNTRLVLPCSREREKKNGSLFGYLNIPG